MTMSRLFGLACLSLVFGSPALAREQPTLATCPYPEGWKPTNDELQRILSEHQVWLKNHPTPLGRQTSPEGTANLCNADLSSVDLNGADLSWARLNNARLLHTKLNNAILVGTKLNKANLVGAELKFANLSEAELNQADLFAAQLVGADLYRTKLDEADLSDAQLRLASMTNTSLAGAHLDNADLTDATYAPSSPAPDGYVAQIKGLRTVYFPDGEEVGLVQLRDLLQKAGHRELEREATFAIESGKTNHSIARNTLGGFAEGIFRKVAFDFTTRYGLEPARALFAIAMIWALLIPIYSRAIWRMPAAAIC